jgi:hypothetical protein
MNDASRYQGWAICIGAGVLALLFLIGILNGSYWAIALPVAVLTFFALGLAGWVGYTIATIQVEPFDEGEPPPGDDSPDSSDESGT